MAKKIEFPNQHYKEKGNISDILKENEKLNQEDREHFVNFMCQNQIDEKLRVKAAFYAGIIFEHIGNEFSFEKARKIVPFWVADRPDILAALKEANLPTDKENVLFMTRALPYMRASFRAGYMLGMHEGAECVKNGAN